MKLTTLRERLAQFVTENGDWLRHPALKTIGPVAGGWLDERDGPFDKRFGVYFLVSSDGDVLYVGKAHHQSIRQRLWAHCRTPSVERKTSPDRKKLSIYPSHRWNTSERISEAVRFAVERGNFEVEAIEVSPKELVTLIEGAALAYVWTTDNALPPLNAVF